MCIRVLYPHTFRATPHSNGIFFTFCLLTRVLLVFSIRTILYHLGGRGEGVRLNISFIAYQSLVQVFGGIAPAKVSVNNHTQEKQVKM